MSIQLNDYLSDSRQTKDRMDATQQPRLLLKTRASFTHLN
jgi:hypothetical protein